MYIKIASLYFLKYCLLVKNINKGAVEPSLI